MHTQKDTARFIVEKKQADYLFTVKANQPTLKKDIERLSGKPRGAGLTFGYLLLF